MTKEHALFGFGLPPHQDLSFSVFFLPMLLQASNMILLIFLQKMDLLLTKTPSEDIKNSVLPMVYRALEAPSVQIQELCLNIIPTFANLIDYPSIKNSLIPRVKSACLQTPSLAIKRRM
ncbi:SCY1-like protein 2 [Anarrhichthys ocellatus]|uniref:SCY1-like protein 2 n=1 Tax=Anarrhichthys ocellatus TaxID=433405 RepID=UPI0012ED34B5|nr:SCY1-like protein 2 [Anarrhichthys ocellatus]